jgi:hypothetical protein
LLATWPAAGQQPSAAVKLDGDWAVTLTLPLGDTWFNMFIVQKGNDLTGYLINEVGQFDLKGTVNRDQVKFTWTFPDGGRLLDITFSGKVERNSMSGYANVGDVGQGTMTAQRK